MSELREYLAPLVNRERKIKPIWNTFADSWEILVHGLVPHERSTEAQNKILAGHIGQDDEHTNDLITEVYKESRERIDDIEEKGFKLLTYISAVSAISIYFLSRDISGFYKATVIISLFFLVLAIIISLRCIGVKGQKALFIEGLFDFKPGEEPKTKNKKEILANLLNYAVYNHGVADNTADILKATRIMLSLGIFATAISCIFFLSEGPEKLKVYQVKLADSTSIQSIVSDFKAQQDSARILSRKLDKLQLQFDSLKAVPKSILVPVTKR